MYSTVLTPAGKTTGLPTVYPGSAFTDIVVIVGVPQLSEEEANAWMLNGEVHWLAGLVKIVVLAGQAMVGGVTSGLHGSTTLTTTLLPTLDQDQTKLTIGFMPAMVGKLVLVKFPDNPVDVNTT
jgi:hypothetical protein